VRFYWKLSPEADRRVRDNVGKRLLERHRRNWDAREDEMPLLEFPSGREELAFYRSRDYGWWVQLAATYPDRALYRFTRWVRLARKYGIVSLVPPLAPQPTPGFGQEWAA
jgi:hypothetical protein